MDIDPVVIVAYLFGLLMVYIVLRVLLVPARLLLRVLVHGVLGGVALAALNFAGQYVSVIDLYVPINPVTAVTTGFLGLPGVLLLLALRHWLVAPIL